MYFKFKIQEARTRLHTYTFIFMNFQISILAIMHNPSPITNKLVPSFDCFTTTLEKKKKKKKKEASGCRF